MIQLNPPKNLNIPPAEKITLHLDGVRLSPEQTKLAHPYLKKYHAGTYSKGNMLNYIRVILRSNDKPLLNY
jgi:hypothetical protein